MAWLLVDSGGRAYRVPPSISLPKLSVGGVPRVRFVRGYGSSDWYVTQDGLREPEPLTLTGVLHTDRDEAGIHALTEAFQQALDDAVLLVQLDANGTRVREMPLLGALPLTTTPDGIDGTLLTVTAHLLPAADEWRPATPTPKHFSSAFSSAFSGGVGSPQEA